MKISCTSKDTIHAGNMQSTDERKIFAAYVIQDYYPECIENSSNSTTKNPNNLIHMRAKDFHRHTNKHMKTCLTSLIINKMEVGTTRTRYHLTLTSVATTNQPNKQNNPENKCCKDV